MTEDFKKWLCELADFDFYDICPERKISECQWPPKSYQCKECGKDKITLEILIKAMWAINNGSSMWEIEMNAQYIFIFKVGTRKEAEFYYDNYSNYEQEALTAALEYIYKETR